MLGVSFSEIVVIGVIVLIVFGPDRLPELVRTAGLILGKLQKEYDSVRREFYNSVYTPAEEARSRMNSAARDLISVPERGKEICNEPVKEEDAQRDGG